MNKYEKSLLFELNLIKVLFTIDLILNLSLPVYMDGELGYHHLFQIIIVIANTYGLINAMGYANQHIPVLEWGITRLVQVVWHYTISSNTINWLFFFIVMISDLLYMILLFMDKSSYEYVKVEVKKREDT